MKKQIRKAAELEEVNWKVTEFLEKNTLPCLNLLKVFLKKDLV